MVSTCLRDALACRIRLMTLETPCLCRSLVQTILNHIATLRLRGKQAPTARTKGNKRGRQQSVRPARNTTVANTDTRASRAHPPTHPRKLHPEMASTFVNRKKVKKNNRKPAVFTRFEMKLDYVNHSAHEQYAPCRTAELGRPLECVFWSWNEPSDGETCTEIPRQLLSYLSLFHSLADTSSPCFTHLHT